MEALAQVLPFLLIVVVFYFLLIRPQRRRQMQLLETQRGIGVGEEVMLGAGIVGRVAAADDDYLQLEISPGVRMKVARQAVVRVLREEHAADAGVDLDKRTQPGEGA